MNNLPPLPNIVKNRVLSTKNIHFSSSLKVVIVFRIFGVLDVPTRYVIESTSTSDNFRTKDSLLVLKPIPVILRLFMMLTFECIITNHETTCTFMICRVTTNWGFLKALCSSFAFGISTMLVKFPLSEIIKTLGTLNSLCVWARSHANSSQKNNSNARVCHTYPLYNNKKTKN